MEIYLNIITLKKYKPETKNIFFEFIEAFKAMCIICSDEFNLDEIMEQMTIIINFENGKAV